MRKKITNRIVNWGRKQLPFSPIWWIIFALIIAAVSACIGYWTLARIISGISLVAFILLMVSMPMNIVYGLIGRSGNVTSFIILVIFTNLLFSCIYYWGFFSKAGVSYDFNQPYVSYDMFRNQDKDEIRTFEYLDTVFLEGFSHKENFFTVINRTTQDKKTIKDTLWITSAGPIARPFYTTKDIHYYQRVRYATVLHNTFLTSLMQEPTDLFSICGACIKSEYPDEVSSKDPTFSRLFNWILILQIFISWIFFGVFISLLYNKFRYES